MRLQYGLVYDYDVSHYRRLLDDAIATRSRTLVNGDNHRHVLARNAVALYIGLLKRPEEQTDSGLAYQAAREIKDKDMSKIIF